MCGECRDEHLKHPDSTQYKVPSVLCKPHPLQQLVVCCKKCQQAISALCMTKGHAGHRFLDIEEVYTKKYNTCIEQIWKITDDILPTSSLRL